MNHIIIFMYVNSVIPIYNQFYAFTFLHETTLNNKKSYSTSIYRQTPLHAWIRSSVSCCPRPSQKPPTLVFFTEYHFSKPIMLYKTFKKLFDERMLFFCYNLTASVNDWTSLPTSRSNYHMSTLRYEQQISIFVTGPSNTQIMKMKNSQMFLIA